MSKKTNPTIAITGANGFVGKTLTNYFKRQGWQVVALVRNPDKYSLKGVQAAAYDLAKPLDAKSLKGVDYVVHAAYVKQDRQHPDAFETNIEAAKSLVAAARQQKVKKCLFMSSMSAHDEAISAYGKQKLAIEKIFDGKDCVSIRSGLIIGNGGLVKQMVDFMRSKHVVPLIDGGKQPLQIISVNDLAMVIDRLLLSNLSGVYTIATPQVYSYKQLYQTISRQLNIKVLFVPVPFFLLMGIIRFVNFLHMPIAINPDNALGLKQLRAADTAGDLKKVGAQLKSLEAALAETKQ
jgi:nucleoside-diphosphate-sugar epimerase